MGLSRRQGTGNGPRHLHPPVRPRGRWLAIGVVGILVAGSLALVAAGVAQDRALALCGPGGTLAPGVDGEAACAHVDEPPPGVDVTEHVSTAELKEREGAGLAAYEAAEQLGVPMAAESSATTPAVRCDGNGTSGYRVQAMYVVEASRPNRFDALKSNFKLWAAGVDDVFNRSAALSGGVRNVRYVTEPGPGGTCEAQVLNVTVPDGAMTDFNSTVNAVRALGHGSADRKYLMWTDATRLCGIGSMYAVDSPTQGNPNNGGNPLYSRVDSGCWGLGNGTDHGSVEAHELLHNLGGVQRSAPHATQAGHCWDERDAMCYSDGTTHPMVQVCPPEREYLLDCNSDDYFSTYADPGSYLDTRWNTAQSRFLIGGGDGSGGGSLGSPTVLGATIAVNNPAVPGLSTQVSVTPALPSGRTLASVAWTSKRTDCTFSEPAAIQSQVTCSASGSTVATSVTVKLVDSSGATRAVSSPLTFSTLKGRAVSVRLGVAGQSGASVAVCTGATFPIAATVLDTASGQPVKGIAASFTKKTAAMPAPAAAGRATTLGTGVATLNSTATVATTYAASVATSTIYGAGSTGQVVATPARCDVTLEATKSAARVHYGDAMTVSGTLTRIVSGVTVPVASATFPVRQTTVNGSSTRVLALATARTAADGTWSVAVKPTMSGPLSVALAGSAGYSAALVDLGTLTVDMPTSELTGVADRTTVGYGGTVTVTGRLTRTAGDTTTGAGGQTVAVKVASPGKAAVVVGTSRTLADGTYRVAVPLRLSGPLTVVYAGTAGLPADTVSLGVASVGNWSTATAMGGTRSASALTLSGAVTRTYQGAHEGARGVRVTIWFTPTGSSTPTRVGVATTGTSGSFAVRLSPRASGSYTASTTANLGHAYSSSGAVAVTVG